MTTGERWSFSSSPASRAVRSGPLVSVIVPAHNAAPFIGSAINSACRQTYQNIEVLVVDDGSQDDTAEIVRSMAMRDRRVRLFRQSRRGVAAARNKAIRESRGEYIAPLDADDVWHPGKIARQVRRFRRGSPDLGLVYAWSVYIDEDGRLTGGYYAHDLPPNIHAALIFRNLIGCGSVPLIRRRCFARAGMYNVEYAKRNAQGCEDLDLYLRIAERYDVVVVREFLVGYRQSSRCMSSHTGPMARSFYFTMRDCRRRRPDIPWKVFRWSLAKHCFYLHHRATSNGAHWKSINLLFVAAWFDPGLLGRRRFYRALLAAHLRPLNIARVVRRWRASSQGAGGARPVTLADIIVLRAGRAVPLFDTFEKVYQRRLRFTERLLDRARREFCKPARKALRYAPLRLGKPPA